MIGVVYFPNGIAAELWDVAARVYTKRDEKGSVLEQRPFTADENAEADALTAASRAIDVRASLTAKSRAALVGNRTYLQHAPIGGGTLTAAALSAIVRQLTDQVDALTRQNQALIRLAVEQLDTDDA